MPFELPSVGFFLLLRGRLRRVVRDSLENLQPHSGWPYQRLVPGAEASLLIVGDSTAVGTGATKPEQSVAGHFARLYCQLSVSVVAKNGMFLEKLRGTMNTLTGQRYDMVAVFIGANDILQFTSFAAMRDHIESIVRKAKRVSDHVVIVGQGNLGNAPLFPKWFARRLTARSRIWRDIISDTADKYGALHVDLFHEASDDPWKNPNDKFWWHDLFHPTDDGYAMWYEQISSAMRQRGWLTAPTVETSA